MKKRFEEMKRTERKKREYEMAMIRTVFNVIGGVSAVIAVLFTILNFCKLWLNGGY